MSDENNKVEHEPQGSALDIVAPILKTVTPWRTYVIYALIGLAVIEGGIILWQRGTVAAAKLEVAHKDAEVNRITLERDIANTNEKSCRVNLDDQNRKISDAGKRYDNIQKEMKELSERLKDMDVYKPADDVRKQPTPTTCQEALDFMNRNFP